jgi:L-arabinonolactonase
MTVARAITVLHHAADLVGESPLWAPDERAVWWVDIQGRAIRRLDGTSGAVSSIETPFMPGALALDGDGTIVVAGGTGWFRLGGDGAFDPLAAAPGASTDVRMNDGCVDAAGRFWAGTIPLKPADQPKGRLYRLDRDGPHLILDGLRTQNGTAFSPDGSTFYLADSHPDVRTIWAFDVDAMTGDLSNRRVFHTPAHGRPDGAAMDTDGCYWFAAIEAGLIVRLDPDGKAMSHIALPVSRPTNLAFIGDGLSTLCVTSMSAGLDETRRAAEPLAGALFAVDVDARGWPQPRFTQFPAASDRRTGSLQTG